MAYIIEIQKYIGITLPIVLDSPSGREVDQKNIEDLLSEELLQDPELTGTINIDYKKDSFVVKKTKR